MSQTENSIAPKFTQPDGGLTILYNKVSDVAAMIFYVLFGGLSLMLLLSNGFSGRSGVIVAFNLALVAVMIFIRARAKKRSVKRFDAAGAITFSGEQLPWADFRGRVLRTAMRRGRVYIWRTELVFVENRRLWILPQRIKNIEEVSRFLNTLPLAKDR